VTGLPPHGLHQTLRGAGASLAQPADRPVKQNRLTGCLTAVLRHTRRTHDDATGNHTIVRPWAESERVLAYVDGAPGGDCLIRHAHDLAERLGGSWAAIHVDDDDWRDPSRAASAVEALRLAQHIGGESVTIPGANAAAIVLDYARANSFGHIVIAAAPRFHWPWPFRGSTAQRLISRADGLRVHVLAEESSVRLD
jgi:two-component system, OmpR family, sensor histidine kinase KdpD